MSPWWSQKKADPNTLRLDRYIASVQRIEDVGVAKLFKEENGEFAENLRYKSKSVQRTIQLFQQKINLRRNIDVTLGSKITLFQFFDAPNFWSPFPV